jgi:hypothetical protein
MTDNVFLIANGDLRLSANQNCWAAQERVEQAVMMAVRREGRDIRRGHSYDLALKHGFIGSQKQGIEVFRNIPPDAPLIVCEAVWQYSHQILAGLVSHQGPILTVANWNGEWPGLVGMLNLNACLVKAGVPFSTLWSADGARISRMHYFSTGFGNGREARGWSMIAAMYNLSKN